MDQIIIRKYRKDDRGPVRKIAWDTAFLGEAASAFFDSRTILAEFLTAYFTDYEPRSCFVAEADGRVVGYLIGAKDTRNLERVFGNKIWPRLLIKAARDRILFKIKNLTFLLHCLISYLRAEFTMPDFSKDYPATLHINLDKDYRDQKIGSRLICAYFEYLISQGISGVRLATMSERASSFFAQQGFNLLFKGKRSYFSYLLHKDIPIYIYGKKF